MISPILLTTIAGTLAAAQRSTVIPLMIPAVDPGSLVASVVDASPAITTFAVDCADKAKDASECGLPHATTIAQGPSTWSIHYSSEADFGSIEQDMRCDIDRGRDSIRCEVDVVHEYDGSTFTTSTAVETKGLRALFRAVTVTAGLELLEPSPGATEDLAAATATDDGEDVILPTLIRSVSADATQTSEPDDEDDVETTVDTTAGEASETADIPSTTLRSTTSSQVTTSSQPTVTLTPTSTPLPTGDETTTTRTENAAFPRATHNAVIAGAAAIVGGIMML